MEKPVISFVVAMSKETRAIGKNNELLWKIPEDMKRFRTLTTGHPMIMGRKTFDSIGHPLPNRTNIVITRDTFWDHEGVLVCHTLEEALSKAKELDQEEITIIGGAQIFSLAMPVVTRIYLTLVDDTKEGDVYFPQVDMTLFSETEHQEHIFNNLSYTFVTLERNSQS